MKIVMMVMVAFLVAACGDQKDAEIGERTTMDVSARVFNAGKVIRGEVIEAEFVVTNTGNIPLQIAEVQSSCSCTVGDYPKDPIAPGETGIVTASVDTDRVGGAKVDKAITIMANTSPNKMKLKIKGTIVNN